jgi:hypothetical protein
MQKPGHLEGGVLIVCELHTGVIFLRQRSVHEADHRVEFVEIEGNLSLGHCVNGLRQGTTTLVSTQSDPRAVSELPQS